MTKAKILVLDDHPLMRLGYRSLIGNQPDMEVIGDVGSASEALDFVAKKAPDLIIVDISLPGMSGMEFIKQLRQLHSDVPALVVSMHEEELYGRRVLRAGAQGFLMKTEVGNRVVTAIREILEGEIYLSPEMQRKILQQYSGRESEITSSPLDVLGDRELEVFEHIGKGRSSREIAERMHISPKTVDTYRGRIKTKLGIDSGPELVQKAVLWTREAEK